MNKQTLTWTALPNGVFTDDDGVKKLRLSVFVSPRLQTDAAGAPNLPLSDYPDFLDWPAKMAAAEFEVQFVGGPTISRATRVPPVADPAPSSLWRAVFSAKTPVTPYQFQNLAGRTVNSYSVAEVSDHLRDAYQVAAAESPWERPQLVSTDPKLAPVREFLGDVGLPAARRRELHSQVRSFLQGQPVKALRSTPEALAKGPGTARTQRLLGAKAPVFAAGVSPRTMAFQRAQQFFTPMNARNPRLPGEYVRVPVAPPAPDFHGILGSLGRFPEVLRRMALVIDLKVPFDPAMTAATAVRVVPRWTSEVLTANAAPQTRCQVTTSSFVAAPRTGGSDVSDGMLDLGDSDVYEVGQLDVDAAALAAAAQAEALAAYLAALTAYVTAVAQSQVNGVMGVAGPVPTPPPPPPDSSESTLPALRTAGVWVARVNRAAHLAAEVLPAAAERNAVLSRMADRHFASAAAQRAAVMQPRADEEEAQTWYAEDLVRGFCVDVWDQTDGKWRSLCQREGAYHFHNPDSGVDATVTVEDEGWVSSAATQPADGSSQELNVHEALFKWQGWSLAAPRPDAPVAPGTNSDAKPQDYGLNVSFTAKPGSLPRLRFGRTYRLRARVVDLAGNTLRPEVADDTRATEPITYTRHEPVNSPVLLPRQEINTTTSPGESVERVVIRSLNDAPPKDAVASPDVAQRHAGPPPTSQVMAESHGMFDAAGGMKSDPATFQSLLDHDRPIQKWYDADLMPLQYLPDPLALAALVRIQTVGADGKTQEQAISVPFAGTWPDPRPFRLEVREPTTAAAQAQFDAGSRVLLIPLPKAHVATVVISSVIPAEYLPHMEMWQWMAEGVARGALQKAALPRPQLRALRRQMADASQLPTWSAKVGLSAAEVARIGELHAGAAQGRHVLLTPSRTLTLVHAVQQPLMIPTFQGLTADKRIGDTFAELSGIIPLDGKSTMKVDVLAAWADPVDDLAQPGPTSAPARAHVCELHVEELEEAASLTTPLLLKQIRALGATPALMAHEARTMPEVRGATPPTPATPAPGGRGIVPRARMRGASAGLLAGARTGAVVGGVAARPPGWLAPGLAPLTPKLEGIPTKHEFGDTKYRKVAYTAMATTRFREYFPFSDADLESGRVVITRTSDPAGVEVLSSARPAAPKVLYVVPTFAWQRRKTATGRESTRLGGGLRVYLERPWYSSGDGELLGVVLPLGNPAGAALSELVAAGPSASNLGLLKPLVTQMGADPVWATSATPFWPTPPMFKTAVATETGLTLDELHDSNLRVAVVGHPVAYDPDRQLWYCDLEIDPGSSYFPFVRLALARYQPKSVKTDRTDVKLSRVVLADFAQLTPHRSLAVAFESLPAREGPTLVRPPRGTTPARRELRVTLTGLSYGASKAARGPGEVEVTLERRAGASADDLGWVPVPDSVFKLEPRPLNDLGLTLWSGPVVVPGELLAGPLRLVVKEYEQLSTYRESPPGALIPRAMEMPPVARRLVYADALEI